MSEPMRRSKSATLSHSKTAVGFYEAYAHFSRNLRTWLLAYGVGAPVIFLTNEAAGKKLIHSGQAEIVATFFLVGVGLQVLATWVYKYAMWFLYSGEVDRSFQKYRLHKASDWVSECYLCELVLDMATILLFLAATWRVVRATLI